MGPDPVALIEGAIRFDARRGGPPRSAQERPAGVA